MTDFLRTELSTGPKQGCSSCHGDAFWTRMKTSGVEGSRKVNERSEGSVFKATEDPTATPGNLW